MATNYPASLDTTTNLPSSPDPFVSGATTGHLSHPPTAHGAIRALETKLGIGSSTATGAATGHALIKNADGTTSWQAQTLDPGGTGTYRTPAPLGSGSDDRAQLISWLGSVPPANSTIQVRTGYLLSARLPLPSGHRYVGEGVAENAAPPHFKLMNNANPAAATDGVVVAKEWDDNNALGGIPTIYENLAIDGNAANNTGTYSCFIPFNYWSRVINCRFDSPRLHHVILTKLMKNGSASSIDHADNRLYGNRMRNGLTGTAGAGVRQISSGGAGNHNMDIRIFDNHFESAQHGIWLEDAAGWTVMDNHIWARRNGINIDNGFLASQVVHNYIDGFGNENTGGTTYYGIRVRGFEGLGCTVSENTVDITETITSGTFYCYWLEAQNVNATITGGLNKAFGHSTPNSAHHGFMYAANNGAILNGQIANTAVGFVTGQDFEQSNTGGGGAVTMLFPRTVSATTTIDWASMAAGTSATNTITVPGAQLGDPANAALTTLTDAGNIHITARVTAANTVSVTIRNDTAGTVNPASGTLRATVWKYS